MWVVPPEGIVGPLLPSPWPRSQSHHWRWQPGLLPSEELRGFAPHPRGRFAFDTLVLAPPVSAPRPKALTPAYLQTGQASYSRSMLGRRFLILVAVLMG